MESSKEKRNNNIEIICEVGKSFVTSEQPEPLETLLERAKELIREAKKAGADTCKFQAHADDEIHPDAKLISPHFNQDRYEWVKRNTYPPEFWLELKEYCYEIGIGFLVTPMSRGAVYLIEGVSDRFKIGSGDLTDFVLLDYIRDYHKPIIISSGMSSLQELRKAYDFIREKTDVSILHCISNYPCPLEDLNLLTIPFLKKQFPEATIGFSDHSLEISTGAMAVSLGALIIEKHFTLDRDAFGPDHKCSLLPHEFAQMVKEIREWKMETSEIPKEALGVSIKFINEEEMKFRKIFHKGLYVGRDIKKGELIAREDIIALRPQGDAPPSQDFMLYMDKTAEHDYQKYEHL